MGQMAGCRSGERSGSVEREEDCGITEILAVVEATDIISSLGAGRMCLRYDGTFVQIAL